MTLCGSKVLRDLGPAGRAAAFDGLRHLENGAQPTAPISAWSGLPLVVVPLAFAFVGGTRRIVGPITAGTDPKSWRVSGSSRRPEGHTNI
jgi:hypothetical protein